MINPFDTPSPPDPIRTAGAQTSTNIGTAIANQQLGNINQYTPQGSLEYTRSGTYSYVDPATGQSYDLPTYSTVQRLNDTGQQTFNQQQAAQLNLSALANDQSGWLRSYMNGGFNPTSGAPAWGNPDQLTNAPFAQTGFRDVGDPQFGFGDAGNIQSQFGAAPNVQTGFGEAGDITRSYEDFASERNRVEEGLLQRLEPGLAIERNQYEQQLADQGIRYGSPAYENAMRNYSMQATDARLAAIGQAGSEQQRMADMAAQRAGFQNAAQQQAYTQALGRGEFANKAQQQIYEQALGRGQFANEAQSQLYQELLGRGQFLNAAQQQAYAQAMGRGTFANTALAQNFQQSNAAFNAQNAARSQYMNEQFALRNQPINQITALLSGSQVQQPNFINPNQGNIPTTDIASIINRNFDQQMAAFQSASSATQNLIGGVLGLGGSLGGAAIRASDERIKEDTHKLGSVWGMSDEGDRKVLPIHSYKYKGDPTHTTHIGPMAQDVEKLDKSAVTSIGGVKHIIVPKLGEILKAA